MKKEAGMLLRKSPDFRDIAKVAGLLPSFQPEVACLMLK